MEVEERAAPRRLCLGEVGARSCWEYLCQWVTRAPTLAPQVVARMWEEDSRCTWFHKCWIKRTVTNRPRNVRKRTATGRTGEKSLDEVVWEKLGVSASSADREATSGLKLEVALLRPAGRQVKQSSGPKH